jgi:hypothetical protein
MSKIRNKFEKRKDVYIIDTYNFHSFYPHWFAETLARIKKDYSDKYPNIQVVMDDDACLIYAILTPEQIAQNDENILKSEYERLKDEFDPEPDPVDLDEETEETQSSKLPWYKKLFRK